MSDAEKTAENNAEEITVKENTTEDSWAAAMTEQLSDADPWSEALAEQGASAASADTAARSVGEQIFKPLEQGDGSTAAAIWKW